MSESDATMSIPPLLNEPGHAAFMRELGYALRSFNPVARRRVLRGYMEPHC